MSRHLHLNPACIPSLKDAEPAVRQRVIRDCEWSSYGALIGLRSCPRWLDRDTVLAGFPGRIRERRQGYARFVELGFTEELWDPYEAAAAQTVIGSDSFVDRIRRGLANMKENVNVRRESGERRALASWVSLEELIALVMAHYGCAREALLRRHNRGFEARQVLLYLAATYCRGRHTLSTPASELGSLTVGGLHSARHKVSERLKCPGEIELRSTVKALVVAIGGADNYN